MGNLFRTIFKDSSKRMVYEEPPHKSAQLSAMTVAGCELSPTSCLDCTSCPPFQEVSNTDLLLDLCDGIYLARVQGNLKAEWELYHESWRPIGF